MPAPARMRPAGRKPRSAMASWKRLRPLLAHLLAALLGRRRRRGRRARTCRRATNRSRAPSGPFRRYLRSQISREMGAGEFGVVTHRRVLLLGPPIWGRARQKSIKCSYYILFMFWRCERCARSLANASARRQRRCLDAVLHNFACSALNGAARPLIECDTAAFAAPHFGFVLLSRLRVVATLTFEIQIDEVRHG